MNRRDALKSVAALLGTAVTPSVARAVLSGYSTPRQGAAFGTLTAYQRELVATLAELIIPATDTPGAGAARVDAFIDGLLTDVVTPTERTAFLAGLDNVEARSRADNGLPFVRRDRQRQIAILTQLEQEASRGAAPRNGEDRGRPFFPWMKELTLVGYYTSEIGAAQELAYVHVAGFYDGNFAYSRIRKAYS